MCWEGGVDFSPKPVGKPASLVATAAKLSFLSEEEERRQKCAHPRIKITRDVEHLRVNHKDGKGYSIRFARKVKEGYCLDCHALLREDSPGSERYVVFYDCI